MSFQPERRKRGLEEVGRDVVGPGHPFELPCPVEREVVARATEDRFTQVLDNLIANAIDASQAGGTIRVEASTPLRTLSAATAWWSST